jgi:hypothetical protein
MCGSWINGKPSVSGVTIDISLWKLETSKYHATNIDPQTETLSET